MNSEVNSYEERRLKRIQYYKSMAEKKKKESNDYCDQAMEMSGALPAGQPILVDHYSAGYHRSYLGKIDKKMRKSVELEDTAKYYLDKAERIEKNTTISSDDPEAITKLQIVYDELVAIQDMMKKVNRVLRGRGRTEDQNIEYLVQEGFDASEINYLLSTSGGDSLGFQHFQLSNNNAKIKRNKDRIEQLKQMKALDANEFKYGDIIVRINKEANRVQLIFPSKPEKKVRINMRQNGLIWSGRYKAFQRKLNPAAIHKTKRVAEMLSKSDFEYEGD